MVAAIPNKKKGDRYKQLYSINQHRIRTTNTHPVTPHRRKTKKNPHKKPPRRQRTTHPNPHRSQPKQSRLHPLTRNNPRRRQNLNTPPSTNLDQLLKKTNILKLIQSRQNNHTPRTPTPHRIHPPRHTILHHTQRPRHQQSIRTPRTPIQPTRRNHQHRHPRTHKLPRQRLQNMRSRETGSATYK